MWATFQASDPISFDLGYDEIHIWRADLRQPRGVLSRFMEELSNEEINKMKRFVHTRDQERYLACHGVLRRLLSAYSKQEPAKIEFSHSLNGKPYLLDNEIQFNLSHSGDLAIYAVRLKEAVGTDVEKIRPVPEMSEIAKRMFTEEEKEELAKILPAQQTDLFLQTWTRKEAWLKYTGEGLLAANSTPH